MSFLPAKKKPVVPKQVLGTIELLNIKKGCGFATRHNTYCDIIVNETAIARKNPKKTRRSVDEEVTVKLHIAPDDTDVVEANYNGPDGETF